MFSRTTIFAVLILIAGGIGLTATGHWHHTTGNASQPDAILDRHVALIRLVSVPAQDAFVQAQSIMGIRIATDWTSLIAHHVDPKHPLSLDLKDATVGEIMEALTEELRSYTGAAGYTVEGNTIVVAPDDCLKQSLVIYDIHDLNAALSTKRHSDALFSAISFALEPRYWTCGVVRQTESEWMSLDANRLMVVQTPEGHRKIRELLSALRHATRDGAGPTLLRGRAISKESGRTTLCVYDVSDIAGHFFYELPKRVFDEQMPRELCVGAAGIGNFMTVEVMGDSSVFTGRGTGKVDFGQFCTFENQLIIEQVPQVHQEIRRMLQDLRSGRPLSIAGLHLNSANP